MMQDMQTNRFGMATSWSMSVLAGVFSLNSNMAMGTFLLNILYPAMIFLVFLIVVALFWWLKGATGAAKVALALTGLLSIALGYMTNLPGLATAGSFMLLGGLFWIIGDEIMERHALGTVSELDSDEDAGKRWKDFVSKEQAVEKKVAQGELDQESMEKEFAVLERQILDMDMMLDKMIANSKSVEDLQDLENALNNQLKRRKKIIEDEEKERQMENEMAEQERRLTKIEKERFDTLKTRIRQFERDGKNLPANQQKAISLSQEIINNAKSAFERIKKLIADAKDLNQTREKKSKEILAIIQLQINGAKNARNGSLRIDKFKVFASEYQKSKKKLNDEEILYGGKIMLLLSQTAEGISYIEQALEKAEKSIETVENKEAQVVSV